MKAKRSSRALVSILALNFILLSTAHSYQPTKAQKEKHQRVNAQANAFLAKELGVPLAAIQNARGMDYPFSNTLFFAVVVSQARGKAKMKDVVVLSEAGRSWGEICEQYGLDYKIMVAARGRVLKKMRQAGIEVPGVTDEEWQKLFDLKPE